MPAAGTRLRLRTRVLVVVPTLDEKDHIGPVLTRILEETADFAQLRVVVADGGSTDGTREIVAEVARRNPAVVLLDNPARIQSAAVNLAVRRFGDGADVLIRCDAHSFYPPRYCRSLVETLQRVNAASVVVPLDSIGQSCLQRAIAWVSSSPIGTGGAAHRGGHGSGFVDHGHHAAFRMGAFRRVGGYDETFTHNEDAELDCRQRAVGGRVYLDADIRIGYRPRRSLAALARQYYRYGAGRARTVRRHPTSLRLRQAAVPLHVGLSALALAIAPLWPPALAWPAAYASVLLAVSVAMALRHDSACGFLAGPVAATMHVAWGSGFLVSLVAARERRWRPHRTPQRQPTAPQAM